MLEDRNDRGNRQWPWRTKSRTIFFVTLLIFLGGWITLYWDSILDWFATGRPSLSEALVLEDSDPDFRTPPFEDVVTLLGPNHQAVRKLSNLSIAETVGGCRSLSVAKDARFFTVCENVGDRLTAYQLNSGERLWSLNGGFHSAAVSPNGTIYALTSQGTIYGDKTLLIDRGGRVVREASVGGFDLAVDAERNAVWLTAKTIKKCDLELNVLLELNPIHWCGVSIDLNPDGSVWVAERQHPDVAQSTNRIFKVSSGGQMVQSIGLPFSPLCVRVNRSDGSVWVTGSIWNKSLSQRLLESIEKRVRLPMGKWMREYLTRRGVQSKTRQYDHNGALRREISQGGLSIDVDQTDGSLWIGGAERVYHYSSQGIKLAQFKRTRADQKYVAVVPRGGQRIDAEDPPAGRSPPAAQ